MSKLPIHRDGFASLTIGVYVIHRAVLERMNFASTELAFVRYVPEFFSELVIEEAWLQYGPI
jgi:hypothetical protein